ncbi:MAG: hypothetical protein GWP11_00715 [Proteobacteria bacterium]|nr:hypothetical protein [Pseudomonadota bacterium]
MGHPKSYPHGKSIPPGDCCREASETGVRFMVLLTDHLGTGGQTMAERRNYLTLQKKMKEYDLS